MKFCLPESICEGFFLNIEEVEMNLMSLIQNQEENSLKELLKYLNNLIIKEEKFEELREQKKKFGKKSKKAIENLINFRLKTNKIIFDIENKIITGLDNLEEMGDEIKELIGEFERIFKKIYYTLLFYQNQSLINKLFKNIIDEVKKKIKEEFKKSDLSKEISKLLSKLIFKKNQIKDFVKQKIKIEEIKEKVLGKLLEKQPTINENEKEIIENKFEEMEKLRKETSLELTKSIKYAELRDELTEFYTPYYEIKYFMALCRAMEEIYNHYIKLRDILNLKFSLETVEENENIINLEIENLSKLSVLHRNILRNLTWITEIKTKKTKDLLNKINRLYSGIDNFYNNIWIFLNKHKVFKGNREEIEKTENEIIAEFFPYFNEVPNYDNTKLDEINFSILLE
uniref:Uncharacterized protein n=1 Tax=Meloidogyne floridensis TaxID=298350 RepID=A0A915NVF7_9BILA